MISIFFFFFLLIIIWLQTVVSCFPMMSQQVTTLSVVTFRNHRHHHYYSLFSWSKCSAAAPDEKYWNDESINYNDNGNDDSKPTTREQAAFVDVPMDIEMPGVSQQQKPSKTRKQKKNKYAQFSKSSSQELDPWEALVQESVSKRKDIQEDIIAKDRRRSIPREHDLNEIRERNKFEWPDIKEIDPYDPTTYGYVELGTVAGAHGVKGELKLIGATDFAEMRLCNPGSRHLRLPNRRSPREIRLIAGRRQTGDNYLIVLDGINNREEAKKLKGSILYARENERPHTEEDEYYISDLVGSGVFASEKGNEDDSIHVGVVSGIVLAEEICAIPGIGNDMLELSLPKSEHQRQQELVLVPFVPEIVYLIKLSEKRIYIDPPDGLLDLTYVKEEKVRLKGLLPPGPIDNK